MTDRFELIDGKELAQAVPDVLLLRLLIANVCLVGDHTKPNSEWVLIDAGVAGLSEPIISTAQNRFGDTPPKAIILTHGHFDHVGAIYDLLEKWDVPVYAHQLETPYLTGQQSYPEPDPTVGGGLIALSSPLFPDDPIHLGDRLQILPADGSVPFMPGWRWIHTPGHTAGHISLFRGSDRVVIAGDAFITTKQESAWAVLTQEKEIHGPPAYFTPDWEEARESVRRLAALQPAAAFTGHGVPMAGAELAEGLAVLARDFDRLAVPQQGRYVEQGEH